VIAIDEQSLLASDKTESLAKLEQE